MQYISGFRVIFMCVQSIIISFFYHEWRNRLSWACFHRPPYLFLSRYLATLIESLARDIESLTQIALCQTLLTIFGC